MSEWAVRVADPSGRVHPAPKGSMKCIGARGKVKHQLVEQVDNSAWRDLVGLAGQRLRTLAGGTLSGPLAVEATFTLPRPRSHYRTGRNAHLLKAGAPVWPHRSHGNAGGNGDDDKLARLVLDALQDAALFTDDVCVCRLAAEKAYPDTPGADRLPRPGAVIRVYLL